MSVTADFAQSGYQIVSESHTPDGNNMLKMRELPNGTYISVDKITSKYWFKIYSNEDQKVGRATKGWELKDYYNYLEKENYQVP